MGFTDVDDRGYIDMMFVDPGAAGHSVATALMAWVVDVARLRGIRQLSSHVSVTARPYCAKNGFVVVEERHPIMNYLALTNFLMRRSLADAEPIDAESAAT
jgi:putative acetyltransferase